MITIVAVSLDSWAGISTDSSATLDLPYPRLGPNYLDYVMFNETIANDEATLYKYIDEADTPSKPLILTRFVLDLSVYYT